MEDKQWSREDFLELAKALMTGQTADRPDFSSRLFGFLSEANGHYERATEDGKAYLDQAMEAVLHVLEKGLTTAPDTPDARRLKRQVAAVRGKHHLAQHLLENFEKVRLSPDEWMTKAFNVLTKSLQALLDLMFDITRQAQSGAKSFAQIGLFYWLIDELLAAQSLARRNYATLSYSHLRCCMEILDKIELFGEQPELAEVWMSGDEHQIWKQLAPARVREKLARKPFDPKRKSYDPMYEYLCQQGTHSTFTALKQRLKARRPPETGDVQIAFIVGGVNSPGREMSVIIFCIMLTNLGLGQAIQAFPDRLNVEDAGKMTAEVIEAAFAFFADFFENSDETKYEREPLELLMAGWSALRGEPEEPRQA
jgi:hypothetical protein